MPGYLLGLDIGSSSIKASIVSIDSGSAVGSAQSPSEEMPMLAVRPGWAEQDPEMWWKHVVISAKSAIERAHIDGTEIEAIGISYQMHGLVVVDKDKMVLRPSIIWCDSRAVAIGEVANNELGSEWCLSHLLNSPGNFTASKLAWVKQNEKDLYSRIYKFMLPGDYIALKLTGEIATTDTGLSEGIFWDYTSNSVSEKLMKHYGFDHSLVPDYRNAFSVQGEVTRSSAQELGLREGTKVSYRAGDQPNNALSLNVLNPGETAATAGTSGVIYSVTDENAFDPKSRVNTFIHPSIKGAKRNGVLLCINGTGILNNWIRKNTYSKGAAYSYDEINSIASKAPIGADGVSVLPFGNGAERIFMNRNLEASIHGIDFNRHHQYHIFRASQEGIVFALRYGFDILKEMGLKTSIIRAGNGNMFLSPVFREAFTNTIGTSLELYDTDGARGAAIGAGIGAGIYKSPADAFAGLRRIRSEEPDPAKAEQYQNAFSIWKDKLNKIL